MIEHVEDELNIDQITTELAEYICDELCRHPKDLAEKELEEICCECKLGQYICDTLNECQKGSLNE